MTLRCIDSSFWKFKSTIWFLMIYLLTIFFVFVMHVHQLLDVILPILKDLSDQKDVRHVLYEKYHMPEWFQQHGIPAPSWQNWKFFWLNSCFFFFASFYMFFHFEKSWSFSTRDINVHYQFVPRAFRSFKCCFLKSNQLLNLYM